MQADRLHVEDAFLTVARRAAGLFDQQRHRVRFIQQPQSRFARLTVIRGIEKHAAPLEQAMHVRHHRGDPAHVVVDTQRAFIALDALAWLAGLAAARGEPATALASGADGLDALRTLARDAPTHLVPGGWLLLEHGWDQGAAVRGLLRDAGFQRIETLRDLEDRERVTLGSRAPV